MALTADDIIRIMEAAAKHGVLSVAAGDVSFTRTGYVAPAQAAIEAFEAQRRMPAWNDQAPPVSAIDEL